MTFRNPIPLSAPGVWSLLALFLTSVLSPVAQAQMTWTETLAPWEARAYHTSVSFAGKMWVLGGYTPSYAGLFENVVWCSADGTNWTTVSASAPAWAPRQDHCSVVYKDKMWVTGEGLLHGPQVPSGPLPTACAGRP